MQSKAMNLGVPGWRGEYYTRHLKRQQRNWVRRRGTPLVIDFLRSAWGGRTARSDQPIMSPGIAMITCRQPRSR